MGSVADGVRQAVENCLKVREGETAVVITDRQTLHIGQAMRDAIEAITGRVAFFVMENYGRRPVAFADDIARAITDADITVYAAQGAKGELQSFRMPMIKAIEAAKVRHAHMIGITTEIMEDGMCSDYAEIQRVSKWVYEKVRDADEIRVTTERGCDFTGRFSRDLKWIVSDGEITVEQWKNLPDGEVFTCPADVNGRVVIDGCLGDYFTEKYGSVEQTPVKIEVVGGRAVRESLKCGNKELLADLGAYIFETDENSNRVGEFAIGTNVGLTKLIYNLLQDEKFPGIHIAFGSSYPTKTGATWDSKAHVDGVIKRPTIEVDGEVLMHKGEFKFD